MLYRHMKTGKAYRLLAHGCDTSDGRGDRAVAIYCPADDEHTIYVRVLDEFEERFVPLTPGELSI